MCPQNVSLLIICPDEFSNVLKPLLIHKNKTAMPAGTLTLEDIDTSYLGRDFPEKIKQAICHYHESYRTMYFLLVGDTDKFPVRYIKGIRTEWATRFYPSDLYYADLYDNEGNFESWDYDGDDLFGETDFQGGSDTSKVNLDRINLKPDVCVGRIPASSSQEVTNYVNKIIRYEYNAWRSNWVKNALIVSDHDTAGGFSDENHAQSVEALLSNYSIKKLFKKNAPYNSMTPAQLASEIQSQVSKGKGFIAHMGHGNVNSWSGFLTSNDIGALNNKNLPPIISTIACLTATFHYGPEVWQQDKYKTVDGDEWSGAGVKKVDRPMPADIQPAKFDSDSLMEEFLVKHDVGAVAYIGAVAKGEHGGKALQKYFVEQLTSNTYNPKLGLMWRSAMRKFAEKEAQPGMGHYYGYIHQHKVILFGDPSLRIGGISRIQKSHFLGKWKMIHDGWVGDLQLEDIPDSPIEGYFNIKGKYWGSDQRVKNVRAAVRSPDYPRDLKSWPDNLMNMRIDFAGNGDFEEAQQFELYIFSRKKSEMAGLTYWRKRPFGVHLKRIED